MKTSERCPAVNRPLMIVDEHGSERPWDADYTLWDRFWRQWRWHPISHTVVWFWRSVPHRPRWDLIEWSFGDVDHERETADRIGSFKQCQRCAYVDESAP